MSDTSIKTPAPVKPWTVRLKDLYESDTQTAHRFRYGLLIFDIAVVLFIISTSFIERTELLETIDIVIGFIMLGELVARIACGHLRIQDFRNPVNWADIIAIASFLLPLTGEGAAFLRILRTLRLFHTYQVLSALRGDSPIFRRNEEIVLAAVHLCVFIFIMTGLVYETQHWHNPNINNYVDALYFTVTSLTTTGFGDITLDGTSGRLLSVLIMIFGVGLFLRLAQVLFRPPKIRFPCPVCGLQRHDHDAVHCKACGTILAIPDDGD